MCYLTVITNLFSEKSKHMHLTTRLQYCTWYYEGVKQSEIDTVSYKDFKEGMWWPQI